MAAFAPRPNKLPLHRVIVCGSRDGCTLFKGVIDPLCWFEHEHGPIFHVIVGSRKGTDYQAWLWAMEREIPATIVPAEWAKHGKAAGPIRNRRMLELFSVHAVLAFPGGRGTEDMKQAAREAHVPLYVCAVRGSSFEWFEEVR